ncbi:MAG: Coenzyme F420 hydrogenase/dehydrogenase, beta subunit C-terminal domain [Actinobacteria bacterium]|nr:Coenzyme F420 hydrogenase/dehydrogenase, beta subunit C-terminal domain [Actinomycetota bacterium]
MKQPGSISDVSAFHLCTGCGVCAYLQPEAICMVDDPDQGRRPLPILPSADTSTSLAACPGIGLAHDAVRRPDEIDELADAWGPVAELWEGHAGDPAIRFAGSSGGVITALGVYAVEQGGFEGVLHTVAREDRPWLNRSQLSRTRQDLIAGAGSRYAPASPCEDLGLIEAASGSCVFVGKPCDVAAARKAAAVRPALARNLGLTIGIFCAGTPSTRGTIEMLRRMGVSRLEDVSSVHYRGRGWPGRASAEWRSEDKDEPVSATMSYEESWGEVLQQYRQWRCHLCLDHTGEFADIAVGDPWYRPVREGESGRSLVVVRSERGRAFLESALGSGVVRLLRVDPDVLPASQPNLLRNRGAVWGRIATLRTLGLAAPTYRNLPSFRFWLRLTLREKVRSILGTVKRIHRRRLYYRGAVHPCPSWMSASCDPLRSEEGGEAG